MTKKQSPKNVIPMSATRKPAPADLPSAQWLKELQETLKQQSEAAIALVKLTTEAAQRITEYSQRVMLANHLFTSEELRTGLVNYGRATRLITGLAHQDQANATFEELWQWWSRHGGNEGWPMDVWDAIGQNCEEDDGDKMLTRRVTFWMQRYQDYVQEVPNKGKERAKKYFDAIHAQNAPKAPQKRGPKRQIAARGKRYKSKSAE